MDYLFSLKGKEAMLISAIIGIFIYFGLMGGEDNQNKFYLAFLGYGVWILVKNTYWHIRILKVKELFNLDRYAFFEEIDKIKEHDEDRAERILKSIY